MEGIMDDPCCPRVAVDGFFVFLAFFFILRLRCCIDLLRTGGCLVGGAVLLALEGGAVPVLLMRMRIKGLPVAWSCMATNSTRSSRGLDMVVLTEADLGR